MLYVKENGVMTSGNAIEIELLSGTGKDSIYDALGELGYQRTVHIGREHLADLEIFTSENYSAKIAAIGCVTLGHECETYFFETRHAAFNFVKEYAPTIREICTFSFE